MMLMVTKNGLRLWGSGMIVMLMAIPYGMLMSEEAIAGMSLWELAFIILVLQPLTIGWVQRWFWLR